MNGLMSFNVVILSEAKGRLSARSRRRLPTHRVVFEAVTKLIAAHRRWNKTDPSREAAAYESPARKCREALRK